MHQERESLDFDIVFVGAGPANLSAAIHLQNLVERHNENAPSPLEPEIAVIEKGRYPGAHLLSGAVLDPSAFSLFMPDFLERGCPLDAPVGKEHIWFLGEKRKFRIPYLPEAFRNEGNYLVSLSRFGAWLAAEAEALGVALIDSTAATGAIVENGRVAGIVTDDKGVDGKGRPMPGWEPGMRLNAKAFIIGEGAGGSLFRQLDRIFGLQPATGKQLYETGVKEVWEIPAGRIGAGDIHHTFGHPLPPELYGGGWLYALSETSVSLGFVTSAEPSRPAVDPHYNLQLFKRHPLVRGIIEGGSMLEYGAKTITSGGYDAMPKLSGPGFLLTGECAGLVNMQRLKGLHLAMHSGVLAAETLFDALLSGDFTEKAMRTYETRFEASAMKQELHGARLYRKGFEQGLYRGLVNAGLRITFPAPPLSHGENRLLPGGKEYEKWLREKKAFRPDGALTFGKSDSLYRSGTVHEENQPCHLVIQPEDIADICAERCAAEFGNPCQHFCPAGVYEIDPDSLPPLKITPSNCLHCKTCETADPYGIILWKPPEGGGGPGYKLC